MSIICDKFNLGRFGEIRTVSIDGKGWYVGSDVIRALEFNEDVAETIWKYVPAEHIYNSGTDWGLLVDWVGVEYLVRKSPLSEFMAAKHIEEILRVMIKCRERQVNGEYSSRSPECDECYLCYEQGTMGKTMVDTLLVQLIKHKTTVHDLCDNSLTALDNRLSELRMIIGFETEGRKILEETYMDDIGGIHSPCDCYNPYGHFCGDCGKLSCKDCKYRDLQPDEE